MIRDVTVCLPYFENPSMLAEQLACIVRMKLDTQAHLHLIVVDDGSPTYPAAHAVSGFMVGKAPLSFDFRLYRMGVDIPWNQDACRNLAVSEAKTEWVLLTDMDHLVPEKTLRSVMSKDLDESCVYRFSRVTAPEMEPYKPHPNSWLMTREMYDRIGGYDERYAGIYGTDGKFAKDAERWARKVILLKQVLVRCPREFIPDASTTTLTRKSDANFEAKKAKDAEIEAAIAEAARPVRGRFPWQRVL